MLGHVREIDAEQLEETRYQELEPGDEIGQDGVELSYDHVLRGMNGATTVQVDASGLPTGRATSVREPEPGNDLVPDDRLRPAGGGRGAARRARGSRVRSSRWTRTTARSWRWARTRPSTRRSWPSRDLQGGGASRSSATPTTSPAPARRRSTARSPAGYPTGLDLQADHRARRARRGQARGRTRRSSTTAPTSWATATSRENAGDAVWGPIQLRRALQVSSDVFFYTLGGRLEELIEDEEYIQDWATQLGLGGTTGIDIPGEAPGLVPNPEWRNDLYRQGLTDRPWSFGDSINLAVGQGDLQADPLQMAVAYAAIGNGGTVVTPHVGKRAEDPAGRVVQEIEPAPQREVDIDPEWPAGDHGRPDRRGDGAGGDLVPGVRRAGLPDRRRRQDRYGRDEPPDLDQSWYVALAPADDPKVVVAFTFEGGGFGADTAAPATRALLTEYARGVSCR